LLGGLDLSPVPGDRISEVVGSPEGIFLNRLGFYYYGMKVDVPPLDDARVRQALNYAVDRQGIVKDVVPQYLGYAEVTEGPVPPGMQGYDPPVPAYTYDPTQALNLLAQAGWIDTNGDDVLDDGAGTDLTVELWYNTDPSHQAIAEAVADDLRDIGGTGLGATVVVSDTDPGTYLENLDQYPMYTLRWFADYPAPYNFLAPFFRTGAEENHTNYSNPQVDEWLDEARTTLDLTARQALYEQIETRVQEDAPFLNLFYYGAAYVQGEDVLGLVIPRWGLDAVAMEKVQLFLHDHDVMVQEILYPKQSVLAGEPITPVIKVRNAGRYDEFNVPVRCRILEDGTEVYSETQTIAYLANWRDALGIDVAVENQEWRANLVYNIECSTLLPGDEDPSNDQKTRDFIVTEDAFYDGYIRDHEHDDGSICTDRPWRSPDIWVRHQPDGIPCHQDPILGQENYVYVRVRNRGNAPITDGTVQVYYHEPSAGIRCGDWVLIGWCADYPYQHNWSLESWVPSIAGHTCLFARFSAPGDPVSAECDVACDNNIAQRNVEVVELEGEGGVMRSLAQTGQVLRPGSGQALRPGSGQALRPGSGQALRPGSGQASVLFEVSNIYDLPAPVDLVVERGTFPTTGTLVLEFSRDLFSRWQTAGGTVDGGVGIPDTTRISVTHPVSATVAGLLMGVRETQQARMILTGPPGAEFELHVAERIHDQVVGGVTYRTEVPWAIYLPVVLRGYSASIASPR
jgi:hypothetical protein